MGATFGADALKRDSLKESPVSLNCIIDHKGRGISVSLGPQSEVKPPEQKPAVSTRRHSKVPQGRVSDKRQGLSLKRMAKSLKNGAVNVAFGTADFVSSGVTRSKDFATGIAVNVGTSIFGVATFFDIVKEILCSVLTEVLGDYIENFDLQQLTFGIWGGNRSTALVYR